MQGNTIKYCLVKLVKPLLIALPSNLLVGLIYCSITKKMSIVSYSDVLLIIGGVYAAIGGMCYVGATNIKTINVMTVTRDYKKKNTDDSSDGNFNMSLIIIGAITILISLVVATFR